MYACMCVCVTCIEREMGGERACACVYVRERREGEKVCVYGKGLKRERGGGRYVCLWVGVWVIELLDLHTCTPTHMHIHYCNTYATHTCTHALTSA